MADRGIQVVREHLAKLPPSNTMTIEQRRSQYDRAERWFRELPNIADEAVDQAFDNLVHTRGGRVNNLDGFHSGVAAADRASLSVNESLPAR